VSQKSLTSTFLIYGIGNMLYTLIILLLIPIYLEKLEVADYGEFSLLYVTGTLISIVFSFSISNGILRFFHDNDNIIERKIAISTISLFFIFLFVSIIITLYVFIKYNFFALFKSDNTSKNFLIITFWAFGRIFINMFLGVLRADNKPVKFVILTILDVLVLCTINLIIIYFFQLTLQNLLLGYLLSTYISLLLGGFFLKYLIGFSFNSKYINYFLSYGIPLAIANCITYLINYGNRFFLNYFSSVEDVAIFDISQKITGVIGVLLVNGFMMAFTPYYLNLHKTETKDNFKIRINKIIDTFLVIYFLFGFFLIFSDNFILNLLSRKSYLDAALYTPLLVIANVFNVLFMLLAMSTNILKKTKIELFATILTLIIGFISNNVLIKHFGLYGASISQIIMTFTAFAFINGYNAKFFPLNFKFKNTLVLILIFIIYMQLDKYLISLNLNIYLSFSIYLLLIFLFFAAYRSYFNFISVFIKKKIS
jgi:O-antigen/teichoic acid export membrane protein